MIINNGCRRAQPQPTTPPAERPTVMVEAGVALAASGKGHLHAFIDPSTGGDATPLPRLHMVVDRAEAVALLRMAVSAMLDEWGTGPVAEALHPLHARIIALLDASAQGGTPG